jgi:hypothetical protein
LKKKEEFLGSEENERKMKAKKFLLKKEYRELKGI